MPELPTFAYIKPFWPPFQVFLFPAVDKRGLFVYNFHDSPGTANEPGKNTEKQMIMLIDTTSSKMRLASGNGAVEKESVSQAADLPAMAREFIAAGGVPSGLGVVVGPGSFTGIRLGIAFAKGLALGYGVPLVGISVFDFFDAPALALDSGRGDYFVRENGEFRIEKYPPKNALLAAGYDLRDGVPIVAARLADPAAAGDVIPLYIRRSYVD